MPYTTTKYTANADIRTYMTDNLVSQSKLAESMGISVWKVNAMLKTELSQREKEDILRRIDAIAAERLTEDPSPMGGGDTEIGEDDMVEDTSPNTKFQIGDRVKIPSKSLIIGTVSDIWSSYAKQSVMYAVTTEDGRCGLYAENQLEAAPLPIDYRFEAHIEENVAIVTMIATQGDKTWVYARGHAHILHDGEVGMAQAISYASKRMFKSVDTRSEKRIYFKDTDDTGDDE